MNVASRTLFLVFAIALSSCAKIASKYNDQAPVDSFKPPVDVCNELHDFKSTTTNGVSVVDAVMDPKDGLTLLTADPNFLPSDAIRCLKISLTQKSELEKVFEIDVHFPEGMVRLSIIGAVTFPAAIVFRAGADAPSSNPRQPDAEMMWLNKDGTVDPDFFARGNITISGSLPSVPAGPMVLTLSAMVSHRGSEGISVETPLSMTLRLN